MIDNRKIHSRFLTAGPLLRGGGGQGESAVEICVFVGIATREKVAPLRFARRRRHVPIGSSARARWRALLRRAHVPMMQKRMMMMMVVTVMIMALLRIRAVVADRVV